MNLDHLADKPMPEPAASALTVAAVQSVASTILGQIPLGVRMSIGAREFVNTGSGLRMRVGRSRYALVELNGSDLYDVAIIRQKRAPSFEVVREVEVSNVYAEDLGETLIRALDEAGEGR